MEYRKKCLLNILDTRTGKRITATDIDYYHNLEEEKEVEIVQVIAINDANQSCILHHFNVLEDKT